MPFEVKLHPKVSKFLDRLTEIDKNRCLGGLERLAEDPFTPRPGTDIRKLKGRRFTIYRLRVGAFRFEYFFEDDEVWVSDAFLRERGY